MLVIASGKCECCGKGFSPYDTEQSVAVRCTEHDWEGKLCRRCQASGCPRCGSRVLDEWDRMKRATGQDVLF